jgi:hypothetical protein
MTAAGFLNLQACYHVSLAQCNPHSIFVSWSRDGIDAIESSGRKIYKEFPWIGLTFTKSYQIPLCTVPNRSFSPE